MPTDECERECAVASVHVSLPCERVSMLLPIPS